MNLSYWRPDDEHSECEGCFRPFSFSVRRHHCRDCGGVFCHACTTKSIAMFHRGFPEKKVRVCKHCAPYVEVKLAVAPDEDGLGPSRAASLEKTYLNNDTFVKSFQSRRKILAPEDSVQAHHVLNRVFDKHVAMFQSGNDLFQKPTVAETPVPADAPEDDDGDDVPKTLPAERLPAAEVDRIRQSCSTVHAVPKDLVAFPQPANHTDCMATLLDPTIVSIHLLPCFQRLKEGLTAAHHIAVNVEPQPLPPVITPIYCY